MSAPDPRTTPLFEVVQVTPWRDRGTQFLERLRAAGWDLPDFGRAWSAGGRLACSVRPGRWLLITERASDTPDGALHAACAAAIGDSGAVTDLTAARRAWRLLDPNTRERLAAGCRLDLDPAVFPNGHATVTPIAQVPVMVVALDAGWLLMAPSSFGGHLDDWLRDVGLG